MYYDLERSHNIWPRGSYIVALHCQGVCQCKRWRFKVHSLTATIEKWTEKLSVTAQLLPLCYAPCRWLWTCYTCCLLGSVNFVTHTASILYSYVTCFVSKLHETHLNISRHEVYAPCQRKPHWWQIRCAPSSENWATKKTLLLSIESWMVNRDPYFMAYENPYITG